MNSLKAWIRLPQFWLIPTLVCYAAFELLNATISCNSSGLLLFTGLFSFLGFWSLVGLAVTGFLAAKHQKNYYWLIAATLIVVALTIADGYGKVCDLDVLFPR